MSNLQSIVEIFYSKCLTINPYNNINNVLEELLADPFKSKNAAGKTTKQALIGQINMFWEIVPNIKWDIQETIEEGNNIVVPSLFSASPIGNFKVHRCAGSNIFHTTAIDTHSIENDKIKSVYHYEECKIAIEQLQY